MGKKRSKEVGNFLLFSVSETGCPVRAHSM